MTPTPPAPGAPAFDAAVVGSGPNGLAAGIALALAGRRVVLYELSDKLGGSARTGPLTLPGYRHDLCSSIHPMAAGSPFLSLLPLGDHGLRWQHPPAVCAHPLDGQPAVVQYRELDRTAQSMGRDQQRYTDSFAPFVDAFDGLARDSMAPLGLPSHPVILARFGLHALVPARTLARILFRDPRGRAFFAGHAAHSLLPLERSPSAAIGLMLMLAGHAFGWPFPTGGAQAIPDAMVALFRALGGTVRTGVHITHLDQVETSGPVLFQTSPRALAAICGDALPQAFRDRLLRFRQGPGLFKVDYALHGDIPWADPGCREAGTVHLGGSLEQIAVSERAPWQGRHSPRPFVLVCQPGRFDRSRAPAGGSTAWAYCHVPNGSDRDMLGAIEDQLEQAAPGFRDCVRARHVTGCAALEAKNPNYIGGDVNGGAADLDQLFTRPVARLDPYTTPNPRVFLCSASTPPGGGVHGMGGWYAAQSALGRAGRAPDADTITAQLQAVLTRPATTAPLQS